MAPIAVSADLEQADQGPGHPHEDAVDVVLQVVVGGLHDGAGETRRVEHLRELQDVAIVEGQVGTVRVPGHAKGKRGVELYHI